MQHGVEDVDARSAVKGTLAREQFVEDAAGRENVRGWAGDLSTRLFRSHVVGSAHDHARGGQESGRLERIAVAGIFLKGGASQTEIEELDAVPGEENIGRLQVTVDNAEVVKSLQRSQDLPLDIHGFRRGNGAAGDTFRQRLPIKKLEHQEEIVSAFENIENLTNSRMADTREGARFAPEAAASVLILERLVQRLDSHGSLKTFIPALVDDTHPAGANLATNLILADRF